MYELSGHGIFYKDARFMAAFPSVARSAEGELIVVFRRAPDSRWLLAAHMPKEARADLDTLALEQSLFHMDARSQLVCLRFGSELEPLGDAIGLSVDPQAADQDASLLVLDDGDILLSSFSWYAMPPAFAALAKAWGSRSYGGAGNTGNTFLPWGSYLRRSSDNARSFSEREYLPSLPDDIDLVPGLRTSHGGGCRGQMIYRDGEVLLPSYALVEALAPKHSAHLYVSSDRGHSWSHRAVIAQSDSLAFYEPTLCLCSDGTIIAWLRTDHPDDHIASARSIDGGHSFGEVSVHRAAGHPCHALALRSGHILLSYGYRHPGFGVRARVLNASGSNIDEAPELIIRDDGSCTDLGYPWSVELDDGRVLVCYYFCGDDGIRHIAYSLLQPTRA